MKKLIKKSTYYKLLKLNNIVKSPRLKILAIFILHHLKKRYLAVHFDPVNACNLRCKMCYFTDKDYVKKLKGIFPKDDLKNFGKSILSRALKLQIGCGTEPTLYKHLKEVIEIGKSYNVPFISITTNANTIELNQLKEWCEAGLNEITVSLHGVTKKSYEYFMGKGNFQRFLQSLNYINIVKQEFPSLKLRINYTFNEDNFEELNNFWEIFKDFNIDTLQIRPIKKMGETEYSNFSLKKIIPNYEKIHQKLIDECKKRNTSFLAPKLHQIQERTSISSIIQNFTYCYISPTFFWRKDFDWKNESFDDYSKRSQWSLNLLKKIFSSKRKLLQLKNESLNYELTN